MDKPAREALKARIDRQLFGDIWQELCSLLAYVDALEDKLQVTDELFNAACNDIADLQAAREKLEAAVESYPRTKDGVLPTVGGSVFEAGWRSVEEHKVRLHGYTRYEFDEAIAAVEDCFSTYDAARAELDARQAQSEAS